MRRVTLFDDYLRERPITLTGKRSAFPRACEREAWEALPPEASAGLVRWGEEAFSGYPARTATMFLAFTRTGDRQADEKPYFARRRLLMGAALAECAEHQGRFLDAILDGLWCICEETSWVISAHNGSSHEGSRPAKEHPLPDKDNPYIDLFSAQTAATLSYVCYLLKDELDGVSPLIARRVKQELTERIVKPFLHRDDFWWMGFIRKDLNNWTPWIVSNVIDTLLLTVTDDDALLRGALARAMRMLDGYLSVMPDDGGCDEGAAYWNMAGGSLLDCLESLMLSTGADFFQNPLIRAIGAFPVNAHIAGDWYWNFADCDAKPVLDGERLYTYGVRTGSDKLIALGAKMTNAGYPPRDTPQMNRVLSALFTRIQAPAPVPEGERTVILPDLQAFAFERGGLYAAIKGGHNGESHNHNDVGTFLLYMDGQPKVIDAGNMVYTAKTFGSERYTLWNTRARNHNIPLIAGCEQFPGADARAKDVQASENGASMDVSAAYPKEAGVTRFVRALHNDGSVTVSDDILLSSPAEISWVFLLRDKPAQEKGALRFGGMTLRYDDDLTYELEEYPVTDARMARNFPGSLWRVTLTAAPQEAQTRRFRFTRS